jgi:hypothetical protein
VPSALRSIARFIRDWVAACRVAWRSGGTCDRARVFWLAITAIRTSAFSTAHSATGEIHFSCSSEAYSK